MLATTILLQPIYQSFLARVLDRTIAAGEGLQSSVEKGRVTAKHLCQTDRTAEYLLLSSPKASTFNEVLCARGLARDEVPSPHLSNCRLQINSNHPSPTLVTCCRKRFFSANFLMLKSRPFLFCSSLGKSGSHTLLSPVPLPPVDKPLRILLISCLHPSV